MGFSTNFVAINEEVDGNKISFSACSKNPQFCQVSAVKYGKV